MWKPAAAMFAGVLLLLILPALPPAPLMVAACLSLLVPALLRRRWRWLLLLPMGFLWTWWCAQSQLNTRLDPAMEGRDLGVSGWIHSIPADRGEFTSYELQVETLEGREPGKGVPVLLRLNWSHSAVTPRPGEHWHFTVRLRRPRGFMNPGGFDYEAWLMVHGFGATGYVVKDEAQRLDDSNRYPLVRMRAALRERIRQTLAGNDFSGMVVALATGDQGDIDADQWQVLSATNTVHLMAIAGLHIGVVAGFAFLLVPWLWRRSRWLCSRCPASVAGSVAALLAAVVYAALAGFPLPTQRALVMLAAGTLGVLLRRRLRPADVLGLALMVVLFIDPLSAVEPGFWLSFVAVAAILYVFSGRSSLEHHWLLELVRTQWAVGIGLLPLLAYFFHQAGLTAPLANLVVVPLYCFLVVPLVLGGAALSFLWPWVGAALLKGAAWVMAFCWPFLERLAAVHVASLPAPAPDLIACLVAFVGVVWLLAPRGLPARWLGAVSLLPLFLTPASGIASGSFEVTLLDVSQGLSTVVRTAGHILIFDTGPKFYGGTDTGQEVVIPYLQAEGIRAPDLVMVSHGDNDHAGGLASLRAAYPGVPVLSGDAEKFSGAEPCGRGQRWDWDGVAFTILSPDAGTPYEGNNSSCVLKISGPGGSVLFTGDIERPAENRLLATDAASLRSDLLVAPHHGSNSSSTEAFVTAVAPTVVLFPVGYRNRWGFPKAEVAARYRGLGSLLADSANDGAIRVRFTPGTRPAMVMRYRPDAAHFWTER